MFKKIGLATCLASLAWLFGVLGLFIGEAVFSTSWSYTETLIKFPFGAIACIVILSMVFIKLYSLGKESFYQFLVAISLYAFLYFLVTRVLEIDWLEKGSIAETAVQLSLVLFSWFVVLGFCKLWKKIKENPIDKDYWVDLLS